MNCENPQRIYNKYLGHYVTVPCGKCASCKITRCNSLAARVANECDRHVYNLFFTLTYSNDFVPYLDRDCNLCSCDGRFADGLPFTSDLQELKFKKSISSIKFERPHFPMTNFGDSSCLSVLIKYDLQNFIKRVRAAVAYHFYEDPNLNLSEYEIEQRKTRCQLRFFACGEYGTDYHRCHFHGIFHSNDLETAEFVRHYILKAWTFCDWNKVKQLESKDGRKRLPSYVSGGSASSYVASYVNSIDSFDNALENGYFKPFVLFSKRPIYGMSKIDSEILQDGIRNFNFNPVREVETSINGELFTSRRFFSSFLLRSLFPRFDGIDKLSFKDLLGLCLLDSRNKQKHSFYTRCRAFCMKFFGFHDVGSISNYLFIRERFLSAVKSRLIADFMQTFNPNKPLEYVKSCYHTLEDSITSRITPIHWYIKSVFGVDFELIPWRDFGTTYATNIDFRKWRYAEKLLPKHYYSKLYKF